MWITTDLDFVILGCYTSKTTWRLDCWDDMWNGEVGNCTVGMNITLISLEYCYQHSQFLLYTSYTMKVKNDSTGVFTEINIGR